MVENSFPKLLTAFIVITLFAFVILGTVTTLAGNYNKDTTEINERIGLTSINSTLATAQETASGWQNTFQNIGQGNIFSDLLDILGLLSVGMFNLAKSMATFIFIPFQIIGTMLTTVLGVPVIVANIINVLIILTIIFGVWSLVKRGI
jgi:Flp pilus assembly protein TadB